MRLGPAGLTILLSNPDGTCMIAADATAVLTAGWQDVAAAAHATITVPAPCADRRSREGRRATARTERVVPDYYLIPILLVVMSLALTALIYWGGFVEERRNGARNP